MSKASPAGWGLDTLPPAATMRAISESLLGLWSWVSWVAYHSPPALFPTTARESPAQAATTLHQGEGEADALRSRHRLLSVPTVC